MNPFIASVRVGRMDVTATRKISPKLRRTNVVLMIKNAQLIARLVKLSHAGAA